MLYTVNYNFDMTDLHKTLDQAVIHFYIANPRTYAISDIDPATQTFTLNYGHGDWDVCEYILNEHDEVIDVNIL